MKRYKQIIALFMVMVLFLSGAGLPKEAKGAVKQYGIAIADQNGKYSYYDINSQTADAAGIEITDSGSIMMPLEKLTSLMPVLAFSYDAKSNKATVTNTKNGKKVVFTNNSNKCYYYSNTKAKSVKKTLPYKTYLSPESKAMMVHMSALKWVMSGVTGVKSFGIPDMQLAGYDTYTYSGLVVYNPYTAVTAIPKATSVTNISSTVRITIPEGYSVPQVFDLLVKKGVCASTEFLYDALSAEYDNNLVNEIPDNENRCFKLEGYLYPDTYEFYRLSKGTDVIKRILNNADAKLTDADRAKAASLGYSMDEILTIASLIEKEAAEPEVMSGVSSVIFNRLKANMPLQLDATYFYLTRYIKPNITGDKQRYDAYYDTYKCKTLPTGPICNPGRKAIQAALNPAVTDYLYFYSDQDGKYYFTATYEEIKAISGK
jgi:uncharacterized YceG family protein